MTQNLLAEDPQLRSNVQKGLDHLATRLEPIISNVLAPHLGGLTWTAILVQLDELRGRTPGIYSVTDLQAQLRVITERLGGLGFAFDDVQRTVSRLGGELRVARNSLSHGGSFEPIEAWRVHDSCVRLLTHFGDAEGAKVSAAMRDELHQHLPGASQVADAVIQLKQPVPVQEFGTEISVPSVLSEDSAASPDELGTDFATEPMFSSEPDIEPDMESFVRDATPKQLAIGDERLPFESWQTVVIGAPDTLDHLRRVSEKELVRSVATEIVEFEGPIHRNRLAAHVAGCFGVGRLHQRRAKAIDHQINQLGLYIDAHGFVWPENQDPSTWEEFRPSSDPGRDFTHISPRELQNASAFWRRRHPADSPEETQRRVLQTFGRKRLTRQFREHLTRM